MSIATIAEPSLTRVALAERPQLQIGATLQAPAAVATTTDLDRLAARATWCLLAVGIFARLVRFALRFPFWLDEWLLADNLLNRDFLDLFEPLNNRQIAPLGFVCAEWGITQLLGFNEWTVRIVSLVASLVGLFALRQLAARWLSPLATMFVVGFVAVGYYPLRHAVEVKPYAGDLACATILVWLAVRWSEAPQQTRRLWALAAVAPVALLMSLPAVFIVTAIGISAAVKSFLTRNWHALLAVAGLAVTSGATFGAIYGLSLRGQGSTHREYMYEYWKAAFPPSLVQHPLDWCAWMIGAHTGETFAYPFGDDNGGSTITSLLMLAGIVAMWRRGERWFLGLCATTFGLAYIAAWMQRYPYAGTERMSQYLAPLICVLAGVGAAALIECLNSRARLRVAGVLAIILFSAGVGQAARDLSRPYKCNYDWRHQGLARWLWTQDSTHGELYCAERDLGCNFYFEADHSEYFCNQHIYSPHRAARLPRGDVDSLPTDRPFRVVVYHQAQEELDDERWRQWQTLMAERFQLAGHDQYKIVIEVYDTGPLIGQYDIYRYVPKQQR